MNVTVTKSENDPRQYRVIRLQNGLTVLLITDKLPETEPKEPPDPDEGDKLQSDGGRSIEHAGSTGKSPKEAIAPRKTRHSQNAPTPSGVDEEALGSLDSYPCLDSLSISPAGEKGRKVSDTNLRKVSSRTDNHSDGTSSEASYNDVDDERLSAAGLCIGVGSFAEPNNLPGLAHFVEHMVFMGSNTYPDENDFDHFIKSHGGSNNGHTDHERTNFYFDINSSHFRPALERFSQFFICPLMHRESMEKEVLLVHAEWAMTVHNERFRFEQLLGLMAKKDHPMSRFSWGNVETLQDKPKKDGIDVWQALQDFRREYYVAEFMTLALLSKESLDELQCLAEEIFSQIPGRNKQKLDFHNLGDPFDTDEFKRLYKVIPVKNIHKLVLIWALPSMLQHYRTKPLLYLGTLFGHEGHGSIFSLLRSRNWIRSIHSGNMETGQEHNTTWACFKIVLCLTEAGFENRFEVITIIFQYLNMLKNNGPSREWWDEHHRIEQNEFRWIDQQDPQDYVHQLSVDMQRFNPCDYITGAKLTPDFNAQLINECIDRIVPDKMNVTMWSKKFTKDDCRLVENWYRTEYGVEDCGTHPGLHLPSQNVYVADDFRLIDSGIIEALCDPLTDSDVSCLRFKKDMEFHVPKTFLNFYLMSTETNVSAKSYCLTDLYVVMLRYMLKEIGYPAEVAHLSYQIRVLHQGIAIRLNGFSQKLSLLFYAIVDCMKNFIANVTDELFVIAKHELEDCYRNVLFCPERLSKDLTKSCLLKKYKATYERSQHIPNEKEQLLQFVQNFFSSMRVLGLIQGNITSWDARVLQRDLLDRLGIEPPYPDRPLLEMKGKLLSVGSKVRRRKNLNQNDENSVITNVYQYGRCNLKEHVLNELLITNMDEPLFSELRTQKQLGYEVQARNVNLFGVLGFTITICSQGTRFSMKYLDKCIEEFLRSFNERIQEMTEDTFDRFVSSVITLKLFDDTNLRSEVNRHWHEILQETKRFYRAAQEIDILQTLSLQQFKDWSQRMIHPPSDLRRKLSLQVGH